VTALAILAALVLVVVLCVTVTARGITRHEYRVLTVTLIATGALALALLLGVDLNGSLNLTVKADSWVVVAGPLALAALALALLRGQA
jgi:hypothetical protein